MEGVGRGRGVWVGVGGRLSLKGACCQPWGAETGSRGSARCCVCQADSARGESVCPHQMMNGNPRLWGAGPCSCSAYWGKVCSPREHRLPRPLPPPPIGWSSASCSPVGPLNAGRCVHWGGCVAGAFGSGWVPVKKHIPVLSRRPHHQVDGRDWTADFLCSLSGRAAGVAGAACINFHPETQTKAEIEAAKREIIHAKTSVSLQYWITLNPVQLYWHTFKATQWNLKP